MTQIKEAKKYASLLLGCYRTGDANDPEVYISAVVAVLSAFPPDIMRMTTCPLNGLPSKLKWLPTIAEITEECRRLHDYDLRRTERQRQISQQLEERKQLPNWVNRPQQKPHGRIVTWGEADEIMKENPAVKVVGVFDRDRKIPYRG